MRPTASSALYHPLDQIVGSPALVRVVRVLAGHGGGLGVSEIARRARLALPSTRDALRRLLKVEIVSAIGVGRSMVCALRVEHPLAEPLSSLFAVERQQADKMMGAIRLAAASIQPVPLAVWLYGSIARGDDHAASGIDIALVSTVPERAAQAEAMRIAVSAAVHDTERRVSVVTLAPGDVRRIAAEESELWQEFLRGAVVLVGPDAPAMAAQLSLIAPSSKQ